MKQDRAQVTRQRWAPRQFVEAAWALLRRQGELCTAWRAAPMRKRRQAGHATLPARSGSVAFRARVAALALALLLCAAMGAVEAIATTHAAPAHPLAGNAPAHKPTGTPWGRRPTPTASPSPTLTPMSSETPGPQPSESATAHQTVPVPTATPHAREQPGEHQMRVHQASAAATSPTDSGEPPSPDRPGRAFPLLALVMAILGSSGCVLCLLALGLRRLRKQLIPLKAKQLISPAARNWQRVCSGSLDADPGMVGSGRVQPLSSAACAAETGEAERKTEPSLPVVGDGLLSLSGFSLTTSQPTLAAVQPQAPARPFTGPTGAEALTRYMLATHRASGSIPRVSASARLRAAMRKRREDRGWENIPSLTDPGGEDALEKYIRKGRLAWQSGEEHKRAIEHGRGGLH